MSLDRSAVVESRPPAADLYGQVKDLGKHLEIVHASGTDIIINHDAELADHASTLQELFQSGIPDDWTELPYTGADNDNVFTAVVDGQPFVAKRRQWTNGSEDMAEIRRKKAEGVTALRHAYAINSVLSEAALAPRIKRLMQSREAGEIVSSFGFSRVEYVEPVIAYIVRDTGEKGAVYERVEESDWRFARFPVGHFEDTTMRLKELLRKFGIRPVDFKSKHLLLDEENELHLIDTELFYADKEDPA